MVETDRPWAVLPGGLLLTVRLTPRGGRDALGGVAEIDGRAVLAARVAQPPVDGAANAALVALVAKAAGLPRSAVRIVAGETARTKTLMLEGDAATLAGRIAAAAGITG